MSSRWHSAQCWPSAARPAAAWPAEYVTDCCASPTPGRVPSATRATIATFIDYLRSVSTSLDGMISALRYVRHSPLGLWLVGSAAAMTFTLFVSQYMYSEIFSVTCVGGS